MGKPRRLGGLELAFSVKDIIYTLQKMLSHMRYVRIRVPTSPTAEHLNGSMVAAKSWPESEQGMRNWEN
jgi:hypothetical protein